MLIRVTDQDGGYARAANCVLVQQLRADAAFEQYLRGAAAFRRFRGDAAAGCLDLATRAIAWPNTGRKRS